MKKYWPLILLLAGIVVLIGVYFFVIRPRQNGEGLVEESAPPIPLEKRPFVSLVPKDDGHWLKLRIEGIRVDGAEALDYELVYKTGQGTTQGVPGIIALDAQTKSLVERDLLLGSESSGKFRYDEGVETGTLTLRFRNSKGKLMGKLTTEFHLQKDVSELSSSDGKFKYTLSKAASKVFFVTMETFGLPRADVMPTGQISAGPYGIFASDGKNYPGALGMTGTLLRWNGSAWEKVEDGKASNIGVFVSVSQ